MMKAYLVLTASVLLSLALDVNHVSAQTAFGSTLGGTSNASQSRQNGQNAGVGNSGSDTRAPFGGTLQGGVFSDTSQLLGTAGLSNLFSSDQGASAAAGLQTGRSAAARGGNRMGSMGRGGMGGNRNVQSAGRLGSQSTVRVRLHVGFEFPNRSEAQINRQLQDDLNIPQIQNAGAPIQVTTVATEAGRIAILRGTVASAEDRLVAEQLVLLQPSILRVENQLVIQLESP